MPALLRPSLLLLLGLAVAAPSALAQRKPDRRDADRRRAAPDYGGISVGLYGGSLDGMPTGGIRLGVGLARLYAEGSGYDTHDRYGWERHDDRPEVASFGIDMTLPARHPGLGALYGVAGLGVQNRRVPVYYATDYAPCDPRGTYCVMPAPGRGDAENRFYGTLGLGMRLPLWRDRDGRERVALTGEVAGRFLARGRYDGAEVLPAGNVGLSVRLR